MRDMARSSIDERDMLLSDLDDLTLDLLVPSLNGSAELSSASSS